VPYDRQVAARRGAGEHTDDADDDAERLRAAHPPEGQQDGERASGTSAAPAASGVDAAKPRARSRVPL